MLSYSEDRAAPSLIITYEEQPVIHHSTYRNYVPTGLSGDPPHLRCHCNRPIPSASRVSFFKPFRSTFSFPSFSTVSTFFTCSTSCRHLTFPTPPPSPPSYSFHGVSDYFVYLVPPPQLSLARCPRAVSPSQLPLSDISPFIPPVMAL